MSRQKHLSIGYFADGPWAHDALERLAKNPDISVAFICARYNNPDQHLKARAGELDITFHVEKNVNSDSFLALIDSYGCDLFVSMSFDQILKKDLYDLPELGTINCHAGKLPFYRGRNILNWALINGEKEFGITVHYIDEGVDTGDIILQKSYPISSQDDYRSLLTKAHSECPAVLCEAIQQISSGSAQRFSQEEIHPFGTIFSQRKAGDETINWSQSSKDIFNFIRAICPPGPAAQSMLNGSIVRILRAEMIEGAPSYKCIPGAILSKDNKGFFVKTGDSYIRILEWESEEYLSAGKRFLQ